jgi:hypothetical protein
MLSIIHVGKLKFPEDRHRFYILSTKVWINLTQRKSFLAYLLLSALFGVISRRLEPTGIHFMPGSSIAVLSFNSHSYPLFPL